MLAGGDTGFAAYGGNNAGATSRTVPLALAGGGGNAADAAVVSAARSANERAGVPPPRSIK
jgi:hypothetical protein